MTKKTIKYIIFDTETTGLTKKDRIIQIGAMVLDNHKNITIYDELCSTDVKINFQAMKVHGITEEMIRNKKKFQYTNFYRDVIKLNSSKNYIIAHNINYDIRMLEKENFTNKMQQIDTLACARHFFPKVDSHKLQSLRFSLKLDKKEEDESKKYNIKIEAHNAIGDVLMTKLLLSKIFDEMRTHYPKIKNHLQYLVDLTNKPVFLKKITFGKYAGENLNDIFKKDIDYLKWLYENIEDNKSMRYTLDILFKKIKKGIKIIVKRILITNDDGYSALGLKVLVNSMKKLGEVIVVAPSKDKSACGHSLTVKEPLKLIKDSPNFYKLEDGTPSDCIFIALNKLYKNIKPDIIISGINKGSNMGEDITYSGTVAGAIEGVLQGIPSISISQTYYLDRELNIPESGYNLAVKTIFNIVSKILNNKFPLENRKILNINIPYIKIEDCKGIKITRTGLKKYISSVDSYTTPKGETLHFLGLPSREWINDNKKGITDFEAINSNYISITPIHLDMTSYADIENIKNWILNYVN